jgi:hypothetical protein
VTKAIVCFALIGGSAGSLSVMSGSAISAEGFITIVGAISVSCVIGAVLIEGHERDHAAWGPPLRICSGRGFGGIWGMRVCWGKR